MRRHRKLLDNYVQTLQWRGMNYELNRADNSVQLHTYTAALCSEWVRSFEVPKMPNQWSQNVGAGGSHHRPHQLMASSSLDCHRLVEWGRHYELEASMVGASSSHVLGSLCLISLNITADTTHQQHPLISIIHWIHNANGKVRKVVCPIEGWAAIFT